MIPVHLNLRGGDHGERPFRFEVTKHRDLTPVLSAVSVLTALQTDAGYSQTATLLARGRVEMEGLPDLPLEMAFAGSGGSDPSVALASELMAILRVLWRNPFDPPRVLAIELDVEARPDVTSYRLENLHFDREEALPGDTIEIRCVLRPYRGEPVERKMSLTLPETLPDSESLVLVVGNPRALDVAMGNVFDAANSKRHGHRGLRPRARGLSLAAPAGGVDRGQGGCRGERGRIVRPVAADRGTTARDTVEPGPERGPSRCPRSPAPRSKWMVRSTVPARPAFGSAGVVSGRIDDALPLSIPVARADPVLRADGASRDACGWRSRSKPGRLRPARISNWEPWTA